MFTFAPWIEFNCISSQQHQAHSSSGNSPSCFFFNCQTVSFMKKSKGCFQALAVIKVSAAVLFHFGFLPPALSANPDIYISYFKQSAVEHRLQHLHLKGTLEQERVPVKTESGGAEPIRAGMWRRLPGYNRKEGSTAGTQTGNGWNHHTMGFPVHPLPSMHFSPTHLCIWSFKQHPPSHANRSADHPHSDTRIQSGLQTKLEVLNETSFPLKGKQSEDVSPADHVQVNIKLFFTKLKEKAKLNLLKTCLGIKFCNL